MYNNSKVDKSGREEFSFVSDSAAMGEDCYIGAFSYLGEHVKLGRNVKVFPQVYIGDNCVIGDDTILHPRSEEHTSELQSLMRISYAVFCLKTKQKHQHYKYYH